MKIIFMGIFCGDGTGGKALGGLFKRPQGKGAASPYSSQKEKNRKRRLSHLRRQPICLLFVIQRLGIIVRLTGEIDTQLAVDIVIYLRQNHRRMCLTAP